MWGCEKERRNGLKHIYYYDDCGYFTISWWMMRQLINPQTTGWHKSTQSVGSCVGQSSVWQEKPQATTEEHSKRRDVCGGDLFITSELNLHPFRASLLSSSNAGQVQNMCWRIERWWWSAHRGEEDVLYSICVEWKTSEHFAVLLY